MHLGPTVKFGPLKSQSQSFFSIQPMNRRLSISPGACMQSFKVTWRVLPPSLILTIHVPHPVVSSFPWFAVFAGGWSSWMKSRINYEVQGDSWIKNGGWTAGYHETCKFIEEVIHLGDGYTRNIASVFYCWWWEWHGGGYVWQYWHW